MKTLKQIGMGTLGATGGFLALGLYGLIGSAWNFFQATVVWFVLSFIAGYMHWQWLNTFALWIYWACTAMILLNFAIVLIVGTLGGACAGVSSVEDE